MVRWISSSACVVTSPITTHNPFVIAVSHATRACGSCPSMPSSTASETWSQILSGCPSVTDSEVSRYEVDVLKEVATTTAHHIEMGNLDRHHPPGTGIVSALMRGGALALAVLIALACDGPGSGPSLPSGTHWIHYALVSFAGPVSRNQGVLATTSLSTIRADVLGTANTTSTGTPRSRCGASSLPAPGPAAAPATRRCRRARGRSGAPRACARRGRPPVRDGAGARPPAARRSGSGLGPEPPPAAEGTGRGRA